MMRVVVTLVLALTLAATSALAEEKPAKPKKAAKADKAPKPEAATPEKAAKPDAAKPDNEAKPDCDDKVSKLTKQVEQLKEQVAATEAKLKGGASDGEIGELSVLDALSSAGDFVGGAFQKALDSTDIDEKAARHFETARAASVDAMGKVTAIDLSEHLSAVTSHDLYKTHVAPALDAASKKYDEHVQPLVNQHVTPALKQARTAASQTMESALPALDQHKTTVTNGLSKVPGFLRTVEAKLGELLAPVFDLVAKAMPGRSRLLPKRALDRLLFLVILTLFLYNSIFIFKFVVKNMLRLAYTGTRTSFKLTVVWPLKIVLKLLSVASFFMTLGYCCGLCRRKGNKGAEKEKKGTEKKEQKKAAAAPVKKATVEEVISLLEASKKKGKLDDAVTLLCAREKESKTLEGAKFPESVRGKVLDKAVLKKAFGNFKEIDQKKLDGR